jgi:hypothetical protein
MLMHAKSEYDSSITAAARKIKSRSLTPTVHPHTFGNTTHGTRRRVEDGNRNTTGTTEWLVLYPKIPSMFPKIRWMVPKIPSVGSSVLLSGLGTINGKKFLTQLDFLKSQGRLHLRRPFPGLVVHMHVAPARIYFVIMPNKHTLYSGASVWVLLELRPLVRPPIRSGVSL